MNPARHASKALALSMLVMGACGLVYEYTLGVLGNHLMGSSHEQIFVIIGIMMFAMGVGAAAQSRLEARLLDRFIALELVLGLVGGSATLIVYTAFVYLASYQVILFGLAFVIGALIGLEIPLAIRVNAKYAASLPGNLAGILGMDYVGSLLGALLFAYVLLTRLSIARIGIALGILNALLSLGILVYFWPLVARRGRLLVGNLGVLVLLVAAFVHADSWTASLEQRCFLDPIVHSETTRYQHIVLTERGDHTSLYLNGHLQFSSEDEHIYHELLVHTPLALAGSRTRVLVLGGGDGLAAREVLRYPDVDHVTLVDIDEGVTRLARSHPALVRLNEGALLDPRVHTPDPDGVSGDGTTHATRETKLGRWLLDDREYELAEVEVLHVDADLFVRSLGEAYDVAILDFPDPKTVEVAKLFSLDFYRALARRLRPGALVSVQSTSPYHATEVFVAIGTTLRAAGFSALPYHANVPSFGEWGWHLASLEESADSLRARVDALTALPVPTRFLTAEVLRASFVFGLDRLVVDPHPAPNTRMRPSLVQLYRRAWR